MTIAHEPPVRELTEFEQQMRVISRAMARSQHDDITPAYIGNRILLTLVRAHPHRWDDMADVICDTLADLRHAADLMGYDWGAIDGRAAGNYREELHHHRAEGEP